ncbi:unnamed protein product [Spirodela intermedia]|uniref:Histone-binding protein RBBP4-like N-terminal domain-containing protein n=1 Tax=Spirodela intermedia TaxID=51605 RepID=A0A7I8IEA2_SPIIN|nr:unnamed protein product [Spirodela intermedia]CAA6655999.1 unnamed protein product [Spirodela intermedia]
MAEDDGDATGGEEYSVWKKNSPFLYDLLISHPWNGRPSQYSGCHALPPRPLPWRGSFWAPTRRAMPQLPDNRRRPPSLRGWGIHLSSIHFDGEVNRARYMPQNPSIIATKTCGEEVHVFDCSRRPSRPADGDEACEGYGVSWSPFKEGYLLSGSYDSKICLWDVSATPQHGRSLQAKDVFEVHEDLVEDVAWHLRNENLFGSVGDDHRLMIWDLRSAASKQPQQSVIAHQDDVNSLSFSPWNEWILATASADRTVNLFDMRKLTTTLHTFSSHTDAVLQVEWSPKHETILASSAADRRLMIWDLCRIGDEQSAEDADDGPPELLFSHGGHTGNISEFSWNPNVPWLVSSVAEDNILQAWQVAESIYGDEADALAEDEGPAAA